MKITSVRLVMAALFLACPALALAGNVAEAKDGAITITVNNDDLASVSQILTKAFGVRICCEDYAVVNPVSKSVVPGDFESGGPISKEQEYRFSGEFTATTPDEMLDALTGSSPYAWLANHSCYFVFPRSASLFMGEKVSLDIPPCTLWKAICAIVNARSEKDKAAQDAGVIDFRGGMPALGPKDVHVGALSFRDVPVAEALFRAVEAIGDDPGFLATWSLCAGWAKECRWVRIHLTETRDGALEKPLPLPQQ